MAASSAFGNFSQTSLFEGAFFIGSADNNLSFYVWDGENASSFSLTYTTAGYEGYDGRYHNSIHDLIGVYMLTDAAPIKLRAGLARHSFKSNHRPISLKQKSRNTNKEQLNPLYNPAHGSDLPLDAALHLAHQCAGFQMHHASEFEFTAPHGGASGRGQEEATTTLSVSSTADTTSSTGNTKIGSFKQSTINLTSLLEGSKAGIVRGLGAGWPALSRWSFDKTASQVKQAKSKVNTSTRDKDSHLQEVVFPILSKDFKPFVSLPRLLTDLHWPTQREEEANLLYTLPESEYFPLSVTAGNKSTGAYWDHTAFNSSSLHVVVRGQVLFAVHLPTASHPLPPGTATVQLKPHLSVFAWLANTPPHLTSNFANLHLCTLSAGDAVFIPSGWQSLHYFSEDSIFVSEALCTTSNAKQCIKGLARDAHSSKNNYAKMLRSLVLSHSPIYRHAFDQSDLQWGRQTAFASSQTVAERELLLAERGIYYVFSRSFRIGNTLFDEHRSTGYIVGPDLGMVKESLQFYT